jgi:exonuclease III
MRIVTWNCNGALRNKLSVVDSLGADLLVIQECENPSQTASKIYKDWSSNYLWEGTYKSKGIGVFAKAPLLLERLDLEAGNLECFLPFKINGKIPILATWSKQANSPTFAYIGQIWKYLQQHKLAFSNEKSIVLGDFNSNACWDVWDRWWNHSDVVRELAEIGLTSIYHEINNETQGKETKATFYMYRKLDRPYHIDYVFLSQILLRNSNLTVGEAKFWLQYSDHVPLIVDVDI